MQKVESCFFVHRRAMRPVWLDRRELSGETGARSHRASWAMLRLLTFPLNEKETLLGLSDLRSSILSTGKALDKVRVPYQSLS